MNVSTITWIEDLVDGYLWALLWSPLPLVLDLCIAMLWSAHLLHKTKPFRLCTVSLSESISEFGLELDSVFLLRDKTFEIIVQLPFWEHFRVWVRLGFCLFPPKQNLWDYCAAPFLWAFQSLG
jgi:hypothetical protein